MGDKKKIGKEISYFFSWIGLSLSSFLVKIIPLSWLYAFARKAAVFGYTVAAKPRKIALENLSIAFGKDKNPKELEIIAKDCFVFMVKAGLELMYLMHKPKLLRERVSVEGKENLEKVLLKGKGAILVSAHFGNFPLMLSKMSLEGYHISGIMRHMRDYRAEKVFLNARNKMGVKTIYSQPRKTCVEESIRTLRSNELLFIPIDQNFGTAGVFVDFFGKKAATATGPVVLAQRTGACILPCFIVRQKNDRHKIIFEPPLELREGQTKEETILINIQRLTDIIESYIRKYPAEWGWNHRRWKSRPSLEGGV
jgi:KDO2-lipid IV(A) lauroyltransferase